MHRVKITQIGNSAGVILPKDVLAAAGIQRGDAVNIEADASGIRLVKSDDVYAQAMAAGEECFVRYAHTMRDLAK